MFIEAEGASSSRARAATAAGVTLCSALLPVAAHAGGGGNGISYRYVLADHTGSSVVQLDANGDVVERRIVEPYGRQLNAPAPEPTQKLFAGHRLDDDEGLYPAGARTYDAEAARFMNRLGFPD